MFWGQIVCLQLVHSTALAKNAGIDTFYSVSLPVGSRHHHNASCHHLMHTN